MKHRWMCRRMTAGAKIIKPISGNMAAPGGGVVFEFQMGRGRAGPKQFLEGFEGILRTDGYIGYEKVGGPKMVHVACWAHSRRALFEAHELAPGETVAQEIIQRLDELFAIDRVARERGR